MCVQTSHSHLLYTAHDTHALDLSDRPDRELRERSSQYSSDCRQGLSRMKRQGEASVLLCIPAL